MASRPCSGSMTIGPPPKTCHLAGMKLSLATASVTAAPQPQRCVSRSSDTARDGRVTAYTQNLDDDAIRFLWTTGVVTATPALHDVRPGLYVAIPMYVDMLPYPCYHACAPAQVEASRNIVAANADFLRVR